MPKKFEHAFTATEFRTELDGRNHDLGLLPGWIFEGLLLYVVDSEHDILKGTSSSVQEPLNDHAFRMKQACNTAKLAGARFTNNLADDSITHILVRSDKTSRGVREKISWYAAYPSFTALSCSTLIRADRRKRLPRLVSFDWIEQSWNEKTLLDEEREGPAVSCFNSKMPKALTDVEHLGFAPR